MRRLPFPILPGSKPEQTYPNINTNFVGPTEWNGTTLIKSTNPTYTTLNVGGYRLPTTVGPSGYVITSNGITSSWQPPQGGGGGGSGALTVTYITDDYIITNDQFVIFVGANNANVTLPTPSDAPGKIILISNRTNFTLNIIGRIDGTTSNIELYNDNSIYIVSDGVDNWLSL